MDKPRNGVLKNQFFKRVIGGVCGTSCILHLIDDDIDGKAKHRGCKPSPEAIL